jgi:hypothetical protein
LRDDETPTVSEEKPSNTEEDASAPTTGEESPTDLVHSEHHDGERH